MSVNSRLILALTAISLLTVSGSNAQSFDKLFSTDYDYSWDFYGGGARAMGMGNAYTAVSDEAFGWSWNPAGVVDLDEVYMGFDWGNFSPAGEFAFNPGGATNRTGVFDHGGGSGSLFRNAAVIAPTQIGARTVALGLSLSRHFDTYNYFAEKVFPHPASPESPDITFEREGYLNSVDMGFATYFGEKFSFGASANIYFGRVTVLERYVETHLNVFAAGQFWDETQTTTQIDSFSLSGFNFNLGGLYRLNDETRLGLTVRTPFKLKMDDDVTITVVNTQNGAPRPGGFAEQTAINPDRQTRIEVPLIVNLGVAHQWQDNFLTSLDIEYRGFSGSKFQILDTRSITAQGNEELSFFELDSEWKNVTQVRVGGEYTLQSSLGAVPLRAGFGYLPQPYADIQNYQFFYAGRQVPIMTSGGVGPPGATDPFYNAVEGFQAFQLNQNLDLITVPSDDQVTAVSFSLGAGLHTDQRKIDFAYSFVTYKRTYATDFALEISSAYDPFSGESPLQYLETVQRTSETTFNEHKFSVSFTGFF